MKINKLLIEVSNGIVDTMAYVYDLDGNKICEATGSDEYEAVKELSFVLAEEIINIKTNKKQINIFKKLERGTKLKYKQYNSYSYGYYVGVNEEEGTVRITSLKKNDDFSGLKMSSHGMYRDIDAKLVEIYKED